jgi:hypothetical protein
MTAEFLRGVDVPLVVLLGQGVDWAIEAESVLNAQFAIDWKGEPPIDVAALWGGRWEGELNEARILVVSTHGGTSVFSSGRLAFRSVDRRKILPIPHIVARGLGGRFIRGVVFSESDPAMLVLNPDAFVDKPKHSLSDSSEGTRG